ncbi:DNA topoisomerase 2-associated protein pat1 [Thecaphora frezii]
MSFFGFDTTLPRDKQQRDQARRNDSAFDPTFDPTADIDNDETLDAKIKALAAGAQEDVEIYTWGQEGYDGLGDKLDEANDDFNEDTFGDLGGDIGKDFDFGASAGVDPIKPGASHTPQNHQQQQRQQQQQQQQQPAKRDTASAFATTLDEFWMTPTPRFGAREDRSAGTPTAAQQPAQHQSQQQQQPAFRSSHAGAARTLEEVEAEMLAMRGKGRPSQPQPAAPEQIQKKPMTLEEVEAEMLARRGAGAPPPPAYPQGPSPAIPQETTLPAGLSALMQQQQQIPLHQRPDSRGPPLQGYSHSSQGSMALPGMSPMPPPPNMRLMPGQQPPSAAAMQAVQQQAQAAHFARMQALLEAMPPMVQQSILSLPPPMQFDSLESVAQTFPDLLDPSCREGATGTVAEQEAVKFMMEKAQAHIAELERAEAKRRRRLEKIASMSRYNGLMSGSDKDFITRIQISQLITADPYADDFYAHIYFALRGGPMRPGAPMLATGAANGINGNGNGNGNRQGRSKQQRLNRQQNAMLRMQQQVERIVQNRKERIEKSASGAALEGALGRVSLSSTKYPRQMLQISADAAKAGKEDKSRASPDAGHARDAVKQALEGASLGREGANGQRKDPLGKHEVLRILEGLYDTVLALEQLRRNAPPPPEGEVNPEDDAAVQAKGAFDSWQSEQALLTARLWKELRVLEPLEISDPHPFVSLLSCAKGKRLLPRALRHLSPEQTLTALTMVVASFETLDVVKLAPLLDDPSDDPSKAEARNDIERQTETFANTIVPSMMQLAATAPMRIVSGMLALFVERNDAVRVAQTRPGVAFLTIFLSRAETLRQGGEAPSSVELDQWKQIFGLLFSRLTAAGGLPTLFPSTRAKAALPFGVGYYLGGGLGGAVTTQMSSGGRYRNADVEDEPVWNLMAALAVSASMEQQQILVQELREKILENVISAKEWSKRNGGANAAGDELGPDLRIRNVNLLLHALNLDAAQISV